MAHVFEDHQWENVDKKDNQFLKYQNFKNSKKTLENATIYSTNKDGVLQSYRKTKKLFMQKAGLAKTPFIFKTEMKEKSPLMEQNNETLVQLGTTISNCKSSTGP